MHDQEPFNAEPPRGALAEAALTPLAAFYVRGHGPVHETNAAAWRLRVHGLIDRELELSMEALADGTLPAREVVATLQCAGNRRSGLLAVREIPGEAPRGPGATGTARWGGVRLPDVLGAAGLRPEAKHVAFVGADTSEEAEPPQRYGVSVPLRKALGEEVLLAWEMNGELLSPVHGASLRVVVPGYIGARSVKWLERIEVLAEPWDGYFQATAYRLLPADGVAHVDVSVDGGRNWRQAQLLEDLGRWACRLWRTEVDLPAGDHEIVARAWDSAAATQPEDPASLWNPKGYVNNAWARITVKAKA